MQIEGGSFLVTGGASGLGKASAIALAKHGGRVLLCDLNVEAGEEAAKEIGERATFLQTDVTDAESTQKAVDVAAAAGPFRGAICCAGILHAARVVGRKGPYDLEAFRKVLDVNVTGTFNVMRLSAEAMSKQPTDQPDGERGVMIGTASVAAFDGQVGQASYSASKAAVAGMILPIARETAKFGIRVMAIAPGIFETPMMSGMTDEVRESLEAQVPFPSRMGRPDEYAQAVISICQNVMLNGTTIRLDGALRMGSK